MSDRQPSIASLERDESVPQHAADQGSVVPAAARPVVHYNPDAPSEEWGWHGSWREFAPRGSTILLVLGVVMLVLLNFTEHVSHVENYYFNAIALIGALWIVARIRSGRKMRHRQGEQHTGQHAAR